jgi:minor extracellular serine protease Vpr
MDIRRILSLNGLCTLAVLLAIVLLFSIFAFSPSNLPASSPFFDSQAKKYKSFSDTPNAPIAFNSKMQKLDASAQMLINISSRERMSFLSKKSNLSVYKDASGRLMVDLFIQLNDPSAPSTLLALGIEVRTQVGNILVARAPVEGLSALAEEPGVRRVEISKKRHASLDSSRANIGADMVHQGIDLPQAYQGEGVVVGVIDSGIDFTHADFSDQNGSRILHLLEFTEGGGQNEWTKNDIDNKPGSITQMDGNGGGGHGTHVTGIAAGGGQLNSAMMGIAPASDIIFVKGVRDPDSDGGYIDTDVIAGCQYIFDKADQMGKPAVVNLSIGSHFGPHDGTSLYEQSLSGLVGPRKLIVAAAGNEGDDFIHAGDNATANVLSETIFIPDPSDQRAGISMWYDPGVISAVAVFAYDTQLNFLGQAPSIGVGNFLDSTPVVVNNDTLGFVTIDAQTSQDPNNGDGNVIFLIDNNDIPTIDISEVIWAVGSQGPSDGRLDLWVITGGRFYDQIVGFPDETEMPGNNDYSVGIPATAEKVISVGSYTTKNSWIDVDGRSLTISPPPTIANRSAFSSIGPTRDGRMSPNITAPGQLIFSALSSHLTEGIGYTRQVVLQAGGYQGQNGTSQASPHVTGTVALMLQVKNDLTYDEVVQCLSETARTNQFTGTTPNNEVGPGYLDAHAAVIKVVDLVSSVESTGEALPESFVLKQNYPNPFNPSTNIEYSIATNVQADLIIYNIAGQQIKTLVNETQKAGTYTIQWDGTNDTGQHVASGIYFAIYKAGQLVQTKKMVLMR